MSSRKEVYKIPKRKVEDEETGNERAYLVFVEDCCEFHFALGQLGVIQGSGFARVYGINRKLDEAEEKPFTEAGLCGSGIEGSLTTREEAKRIMVWMKETIAEAKRNFDLLGCRVMKLEDLAAFED